MDINCCVCGKSTPEKISEAISNAQYSLKEGSPVIGIICDGCIEDLRKEGIIK